MAVSEGCRSVVNPCWLMNDCFSDSRVSWSSCNDAVEAIAAYGFDTDIDAGRSVALNRDVETCVMTSLLSPAMPLL